MCPPLVVAWRPHREGFRVFFSADATVSASQDLQEATLATWRTGSPTSSTASGSRRRWGRRPSQACGFTCISFWTFSTSMPLLEQLKQNLWWMISNGLRTRHNVCTLQAPFLVLHKTVFQLLRYIEQNGSKAFENVVNKSILIICKEPRCYRMIQPGHITVGAAGDRYNTTMLRGTTSARARPGSSSRRLALKTELIDMLAREKKKNSQCARYCHLAG